MVENKKYDLEVSKIIHKEDDKVIYSNLNNNHKFTMDYYLPIINIPANKVCSFFKWFNDDIYSTTFAKEIPKAFPEGYIFIEKIPYRIPDEELRTYLKNVARHFNNTYTNVKQLTDNLYKLYTSNAIIHYKFEGSAIIIRIYSTVENGLLGILNLTEEIINKGLIIDNTWQITDRELIITDNISCDEYYGFNLQHRMSNYYFMLFTCAMWYLTLYKNKYKYHKQISKNDVREIIHKEGYKHQNSVQVLTTSLYDLSRTPMNKPETLAKKRAGFTYSYQFEVRGHYRHYKSGKVVYINSFTKAENKPKRQKQILLNPKG